MSTLRTLLSVEQAAAWLTIGRTQMYALIKSGRIESCMVGRLRRVPLAALEAYVRSLEHQQHPLAD
jgi:excisionase family DNA binding protein